MDVDDEECECDGNDTITETKNAGDIRTRCRLNVLKRICNPLDTGGRCRCLPCYRYLTVLARLTLT